jgi:hypothetical protein
MMKKAKKGKTSGQHLRDVGILEAAASGKSQSDIAKDFNLSRQHVNRILNSEDAKKVTDEARASLKEHLGLAVITLIDALNDRHNDMKTASAVAIAMLKGTGVLSDKIQHEGLKPFVMKLINGDEIVMGHKAGSNSDEEE